MFAENVKAEFSNLEIHMGDFNERKFKMKCVVSYSDQLLIMEGEDVNVASGSIRLELDDAETWYKELWE